MRSGELRGAQGSSMELTGSSVGAQWELSGDQGRWLKHLALRPSLREVERGLVLQVA